MNKLFVEARHLEMIKNIFEEYCPTCEVFAYGSRINGMAHEGSDLDLTVKNFPKNFNYINDRGTVEFMAKKEDYFYGKHFEALGSAWNALYGDAEEFVRNYLVKSVEKGKFYFNEKSGKKNNILFRLFRRP